MSRFCVLSHEVLFAPPAPNEEGERCDVCGDPVPAVDGFDVPGRGLYVWPRGDEVRYEEVPLCPSCGTAIGVTALTHWDQEEEEG